MPNRVLSLSARILAVGSAALLVGLTGCLPGYRPGGGLSSMDAYTYESTLDFAQTVKVVNVQNNEVLFEMDVPVGKQLVVRFYADHDVKNEKCPDLLRWELMERGKEMVPDLRNSMPVPASIYRRLDVEYRKNPTAVPKAGMVR